MKRQIEIMLQHKANNPAAYDRVYQFLVRVYGQAKVDKAIKAKG